LWRTTKAGLGAQTIEENHRRDPEDLEDGLMSRRTHDRQIGPRDHIAAFAEATEAYAETLDDPDLANVYWGKSLGLWQAFQILSTEDRVTEGLRLRGPTAMRGSRKTDRGPCPTSRPVAPATVANGARQ
jgi:hypothetical protein